MLSEEKAAEIARLLVEQVFTPITPRDQVKAWYFRSVSAAKQASEIDKATLLKISREHPEFDKWFDERNPTVLAWAITVAFTS